jgi:mannose-6-phosphate isomerase-like protein (cupin superfamily)
MTHLIRNLVLFPFVSVLLMMAAIVEAPAGDAPVLVTGKFETPVDLDSVVADWKARGYSDWVSSWKEKGWSTDRTYSRNCLRTVLTGRVEYIIDGQRFVLEPGDELFYPANATQTARNLSDSVSKMLIATTP